MPADNKTQKIADEISKRIEDLYVGNEDEVSSALSLVILKILNSKYKPDLSKSNVELIKGNYPEATDRDMKERGLSDKGVAQVLAIAQMTSIMALDYSPLANALSEQQKDLALKNSHQAQEFAGEAYLKMKEIGFSSYGTAATMIMLATLFARREGVPLFKIARPLIEALGKAFEGAYANEKEAEEAAIAALCKQMGISRKEALKYIESFKAMKARGEL